MRRREFIAFVSCTTAAWPLAARAEQSAVPVIGFLNSASPQPFANYVAGFRAGLKETGYIDGQNVTIEFRWAEGHYDRLPEMAADLVRHKVAVLVSTGGTPTVTAAKAATTTIPIVFTTPAPTRSSSAWLPASTGLAATLLVWICSSPQWRVSGLACCVRLFRESS